jgi:ribose transport system permease protein
LLASGVDVTRLKVVVYVLCGLLAALGGLVLTARLGVAQPTAAIGYEVDVVAATVIGGTSLFGGVGTALGVLLGAGITQMLYNGLVLLGGPADWQVTIIGVAILIAVLVDYWRRRRRGVARGTVAQGD